MQDPRLVEIEFLMALDQTGSLEVRATGNTDTTGVLVGTRRSYGDPQHFRECRNLHKRLQAIKWSCEWSCARLKAKTPGHLIGNRAFCWWALRGLNPRLIPCEGITLPLS